MLDVGAYVQALIAILVLNVFGWLLSVFKRDVSIVDSLWSLMFLTATVVYALSTPSLGPRFVIVLVLVALWAIRLSGYITWRSWGEEEDHRYRAIRQRNAPHFPLKSLYLVFGLQAVLAWVISLPVLCAISSQAELGALDYAGLLLWTIGFGMEAASDYQLARFRTAKTEGQVLQSGLWRFSRHPNYFGECCLWWGFYLIALSSGAWWSIVSPILMTMLLLKVSGVALLERDITDRRPAYADYVRRTNAFFPWWPKDDVGREKETTQ